MQDGKIITRETQTVMQYAESFVISHRQMMYVFIAFFLFSDVFDVFISRFLAFTNSGPHFLVVCASHVTPARSLVDVGGLGSGLCRSVGRSTRNAAQLSRDSSFCESLRLNIRY